MILGCNSPRYYHICSYNPLSISPLDYVNIEAANPLKIYEWPILFIFSRRLRKSMLKMTYDDGWARKYKDLNLTFRCCFEPSRQNAVVKYSRNRYLRFYTYLGSLSNFFSLRRLYTTCPDNLSHGISLKGREIRWFPSATHPNITIFVAIISSPSHCSTASISKQQTAWKNTSNLFCSFFNVDYENRC